MSKCSVANAGWSLMGGFFLASLITALPSFAFAADNDTVLGNPLCHAAGWMTGNLGKGLATVGVGIIAIKAMQGAVTWGLVALAGAGIAIIFSGTAIVHALQPSADMTYCNDSYTLVMTRGGRTPVRIAAPVTTVPTATVPIVFTGPVVVVGLSSPIRPTGRLRPVFIRTH